MWPNNAAISLFLLSINQCSPFNLPLPGGRRISYNKDTGVLRIQVAQTDNLKVPAMGTQPKLDILKSITVKDTSIKDKGYGAFAITEIPKDSFLGFYEGRIIKSRETLDEVIAERERTLQSSKDCKGEQTQTVTNAMDYVVCLDGGVTFVDGFDRYVQ